MSELMPEDEALIARAREGLDPSPEDHARIKRRLLARIAGTAAATAALSTSTQAAATTAGSLSMIAKVAAGVLGVAVVGIAVQRASSHPAPSLAPSAPIAAPSSTTVAPPYRLTAPPAVAATSATPAGVGVDPPKPAVTTTPSTLPPPDEPTSGPSTVVAETELLARAGAALKSGDAARALELLDQHAVSFPSGVLIEEREAERVVVLCALGRTGDARAAGAAFLRDRPRSPLAARVRASCVGP